ncbi:MAG: hypothetical protein ACM3NV_08985 [Syntrophothermus sp.]
MRRGRLGVGEAIALVAALALFACMFLDWYGAELAGQARRIELGGGAGGGGDAWQTLDLLSWLLLVVILTAVGAAALRLGGSRWRPAVPPSAAVAVLGGLATLLVLLRILFPPDFGQLGGVAVNATPQLGAFLGLAAAAGIAYGGYRAMGERGTSFAKVADELARPRAARPQPRRSPAKPASRRRSRSSSG